MRTYSGRAVSPIYSSPQFVQEIRMTANSTNDNGNESSPVVEFATEVFRPNAPFEIPVTEFTHVRRIRAVLRCLATLFYRFYYINFKDGKDIVMQMSVKIMHKTIAFNSFYNGHWQIEETLSYPCPIEMAKTYTIDFVPTRFHSIFVYINGRFTYEFRERQPGFKFSSVEITGDVEIHSVHVS